MQTKNVDSLISMNEIVVVEKPKKGIKHHLKNFIVNPLTKLIEKAPKSDSENEPSVENQVSKLALVEMQHPKDMHVERTTLVSRTNHLKQHFRQLSHDAMTIFRKTVTPHTFGRTWPVRIAEAEELQVNSIKDSLGALLITKMPLQRLADKGYEELCERLQNCSGFPYDNIQEIGIPALMEQLLLLYDNCNHNNTNISKIVVETLMRSSLNLCKPFSNNHESFFALNKTFETLGKATFLAETRWKEVFQIMKSMNSAVIFENIENLFDEEISKAQHQIQDMRILHQQTKIQNWSKSHGIYLSVILSNMLVTGSGGFNIGLANCLKRTFLSPKIEQLPWETDIDFVISSFALYPKLRQQLLSCKKPINKSCVSNDLIRIVLNLDPAHTITDIDAIRCALTAAMTHLRQSRAGLCFVTSYAQGILSWRLDLCIKDFSQLLHEGKLTRQVSGNTEEFPYLLKMSQDTAYETLTINKEGSLVIGKKRGAVWNAPGIKYVCKFLNIPDPKAAIFELMKKWTMNEKFQYRIKIGKLINQLACFSRKTQGLNHSPELVEKAIFAYFSLEQNGLQRVWENALAGMAETSEYGFLIQLVVESIPQTLMKNLKDTPENKNATKLIELFIGKIMKRIKLQYDPEIFVKNPNEGTIFGGFVLYDKRARKTSSDWIRIDKPEIFILFLNEVLDSIKTLEDFSLEKSTIRMIFSESKFLNDLVKNYHPSNKERDDFGNFDDVAYTPWRNVTGNITKHFLKTNNEGIGVPNHISIDPKSAYDLFLNILKIVEGFPSDTISLLSSLPKRKITMIIPGSHSFSFLWGVMLNHPNLYQLKEKQCNASDCISSIIEKGSVISNSPISPLIATKVIEFTKRYCLPLGCHAEFEGKINELDKSSLKKFRNSLLTCIGGMDILDNNNFAIVKRKLDTYICHHGITKDQEFVFKNSIIHFADTNCEKVETSEIHDLHFCFLVNPGNGRFEVATIHEDNSGLAIIDQSQWLLNQHWEIYSD